MNQIEYPTIEINDPYDMTNLEGLKAKALHEEFKQWADNIIIDLEIMKIIEESLDANGEM